jgi:alkanesulfonate monooxygenase
MTMEPNPTLRVHWRLPQGGEDGGRLVNAPREKAAYPDVSGQAEFCRRAEAVGIDSVLTAFGHYMPDPLVLAAAIAGATERICFMIAHRPGLQQPLHFVQQVNTLACLSNGRVSLNIVAGYSKPEQLSYGDTLEHDDRYDRAMEFLAICRGLWKGTEPVTFSGKHYSVEKASLQTPFPGGNGGPEIYLGGSSAKAQEVAAAYADCWLLLACEMEKLRPQLDAARAAGVPAGVRMSVITAPTSEQAWEKARALTEGVSSEWAERNFRRGLDSESITDAFSRDAQRCELWSGAVKTHGPTSISAVGSYDEVAETLAEIHRAGASQFILSGWPTLDAMEEFGANVLPRLRAPSA